MNYLLLDKPENYDTAFIAKKIAVPMSEYYTKRTKPVLLGMFCACLQLMFKTRRNDTLVCWYDFQAVMCWWLGKFFFMKRKIVCINLLLKQKPTIKNRFATFLYKRALLDSSFKATVTSKEYGEWLNKSLGVSVDYVLLRDVFHEYYIAKSPIKDGGYVFCGGNSERDWNLMYAVAEKLPQVQFVFVMSGATFEHYKDRRLSNVCLYDKMPLNEFMDKIYHSSMVCFPLSTEAPAGLTVMISAAVNGKLIMMTDTPVTRGYINDEFGVLLQNNVEDWTCAIRDCFEKRDEMQKKAERLSLFLKTECTEDKFVSILKGIIDQI
ncbi:MAG: hypothetical protein PUG15_04260 [Bacteroidales bacterium]|nr:hypothetical protein [Bacteroidales bacterium]